MAHSRVRQRMDADLAALGDKYAHEIECWAISILRGHKKFLAFNASMGTSCFYDKKGPVDDRNVRGKAKNLLEFADAYCENFGSAGVYVTKEDADNVNAR